MPVYIFVGNAIVAFIIFKVKENIIVEFNVVALGLVVGVSVAIIIVIIMRRLPRVYTFTSLFSFTEGVFASFTLR